MNILKILTKERVVGNIGEDYVCKYLKCRGYKIIERNYVSKSGHEIDIIAENKDFICFVEVKTRTLGKEGYSNSRPADAVNAEKRRFIIGAARQFAIMTANIGKKYRFDVAEVYLTTDKKINDINYMENAFSADLKYR